MIHLAWYWFLVLIVGLLFGGFQVGSIVENKKGYNFADLEGDLIKSLEARFAYAGQKITNEERALIGKIAIGARLLEFWKKKK